MMLALLLLFIVGLIIYFIPAFIAAKNKHRNTTAISILNIFLGWTFLGWVVALVWAFTKDSNGNY